MDRLTRQRDRIARKITAIVTFAQEIDDHTSIQSIEVRLSHLIENHNLFSNIEEQLDAFDDYVSISAKIDEEYYDTRALLETAISKENKREHQTKSDDLNQTLGHFMTQQKSFYENLNSSSTIKLPKISIEPFTGDYRFWPSFKDLFVNAIHDHPQLKGAQKLQQLKSLLRGEAAALIRHITTTDQNYDEAWTKLIRRYEKPKPIVATLIQSFLEQKTCSSANHKDLRKLYDYSDEVIRALRSIGPEVESRDPWLIHLLLGKVDDETKQLWARTSVDNQYPTFSMFMDFLNSRCDALESCIIQSKKTIPNKHVKAFVSETSSHTAQMSCYDCHGDHLLYKCAQFKNRDLNARYALVKEQLLCHNCLRKGHFVQNCTFKTSCLICRRKHHTLLHTQQPVTSHCGSIEQRSHASDSLEESSRQPDDSSKEHILTQSSESTKTHLSSSFTHEVQDYHPSPTHTLLPTAIVKIQSRSGETKLARVLLDSGSQCTFITESLVQNLGLSRRKSMVKIYGLAETMAGYTRGKTLITIQSRINPKYNLTITAQIVKTITSNIPENIIPLPDADRLNNIELADPYFHQPRAIDILIGIDYFFNFIEPEQLLLPGLPPLQKSTLGWLAAGNMRSDAPLRCHNGIMQNQCNISTDEFMETLRKFWTVEEPPNNTILPMSPPDVKCEELYVSSTTKNEEGRWIVRLPLKEPRTKLGDSYLSARARLLAMERKFLHNDQYFQQYSEFIRDYIHTGHMRLVQPSDIPHDDDQKFYLPHHGVFKFSSTTTKLRVVFDASCQSTSSVSLNNILHVGPKLQTDLFNILLKFRRHQTAFVADIEKMYRQILVHPDDRSYQLIVWRNTPQEDIQVYQLQTVTYGLACSPYLAIRTLQQIASDYRTMYPEAAKVIAEDFYIDDLLSGADTEEAALKLKNQVVEALQQSGFPLRKWRSNSKAFLDAFSSTEIETTPKLIEDNETAKTLGIQWNSNNDTFGFNVVLIDHTTNWTKRKILSEVSKIYDPLGWLSPVVILFKLMIQRLWVLELDWDTILPMTINSEFNSMYHELINLNRIEIPRRYHPFVNPKLQVHAFCDASEKAYGCVIYIRSITDQGEITTNLVCAKGKVAPLKQICVPRMELCGAFLLAKLIPTIKSELSTKCQIEIIAWCDSSVVLQWLSDIPRRWKNFIANRTAYILDILPRHHWRYVPTRSNPADLITKGIHPSKFPQSELWFKGPSWLQQTEPNWPSVHFSSAKLNESVLERRSNVFISIPSNTTSIIEHLLITFSSYFKLKKCMVYILRFCKMSPKSENITHGKITVQELTCAETMIIRLVQNQHFHEELETIRSAAEFHHRSKLKSLDPFIDDQGILRVGGRLRNSQLNYSAQFPIVLPKNHLLSSLIVKELHHQLLHGGIQLVLNTLRQRFWIIDARQLVKKCIRNCVVCIRHRKTNYTPKMGDLPSARVTQQRPFSSCGLDYAGPIQIKTSKLRNASYSKAYIALFVCMATKAAHLEVVSSLDAESFIAALRRFVARRGYPAIIWCDNGSNFIGANAELKRLRQQIILQQVNNQMSQFCLQKNIEFRFNPPSAPHFGGLWEATVKSIKFHLRRVTQASNLTFEGMSTMLCQIEAILNSRPLCRIYDNIDEFQVLTPGHFIIGESLVCVPEPDLKSIPDKKLNLYQNIQKRVQGFWERWHRDYLSSLNQRVKWRKNSSPIQSGDVVIIKDANLPPTKWALGRVLETYPGQDGVVRVVKLKTSTNELIRPIVKLIPLPVSSQLTSDIPQTQGD